MILIFPTHVKAFFGGIRASVHLRSICRVASDINELPREEACAAEVAATRRIK